MSDVLGGPLAECPLAFVDLEMTGLDPEKDRIVEVCVQRVVDGVLEAELDTLVCPDFPPEDRTERPGMKIHGIAEDALAAAPPFAQIADRVQNIVNGAAIVAHGAEWDMKFLNAAFARLGRTFEAPCVIDTLRLSRRAFALPSHSLGSLAKHWKVEHVAHRARGDVIATRVVYDRCVAVLNPKSARDLASVRIGDRVAREEIVLACEDAFAKGYDLRLVYRPSGGPRAELVVRVTAIQRNENPPRVVAYDVVSRARRELRADRILSCEPHVKGQ